MLDFLLQQRSHEVLFWGIVYLFILSLPITVLLVFMGSGAPHASPLSAFMRLMFIYAVGVGSSLIIFKLIDSMLMQSICWHTFSYMSIFLGSFVYAILFNIFVDNLYQFNKGDYSHNIPGILIFNIFWLVVICLGMVHRSIFKTF